MATKEKYPVYRTDDNELLGYVEGEASRWQALTLFGTQITLLSTKREAEAAVREAGLAYSTGIWNYFDKDDKDWFPCVIKEAYEHKVIIERTNVLGYIDMDDYKRVIIQNPSENTLVKVS